VKPPSGVYVDTDELELPREGAYRESARPHRKLVITREWIDEGAPLRGLLAVFVDGAAAGTVILTHGIGLAVGGLLGLVGAWMTYDGVSRVFNRTRIVVEGESLTVTHGPLPGGRQITLRIANITSVHALRGEGDVVAVVEGRAVLLVEHVEEAQATFIAKCLRKALGLPPPPDPPG
jgi:hypothetical protein